MSTSSTRRRTKGISTHTDIAKARFDGWSIRGRRCSGEGGRWLMHEDEDAYFVDGCPALRFLCAATGSGFAHSYLSVTRRLSFSIHWTFVLRTRDFFFFFVNAATTSALYLTNTLFSSNMSPYRGLLSSLPYLLSYFFRTRTRDVHSHMRRLEIASRSVAHLHPPPLHTPRIWTHNPSSHEHYGFMDVS